MLWIPARALRSITVVEPPDPGYPTPTDTMGPSDNWQTEINAAGTDAVIGLDPGTYTGFDVNPLSGQSFVPTNGIDTVTLAGNNASSAFSSSSIESVPNVSLYGLEMTGYNPAFQSGVVNGQYAGRPSADFGDVGWLIKDCDIHHNTTGAGIYLAGNDNQAIGGRLAYNGQLGIQFKHGWDCLVDGVEIAYNNQEGYSWGGEAGGTKFWNTRNLECRNINSHHNNGPGLWADWNNDGWWVHHNDIHDNVSAPGIFQEIGGTALVEHNDVYNNGWPDDSPTNMFHNRYGIVGMQGTMTIRYNTLTDNAKGIGLGNQCRTTGLPYSEFGPPWDADGDAYGNTLEDCNLTKAGTDCSGDYELRWHDDNTLIGDNTLSQLTYV